MKQFPSVMQPFLLGGVLVLSQHSASSQSSPQNEGNLASKLALANPLSSASGRPAPGSASLGAASVPQRRQVQVRVELLDVNSLDQQEFFGADEFFAQWVFSEMIDDAYDPRLSRGKTHFGVSQPVSLKKGQRKTITAGNVVFDGVLTEASALSGVLKAMEEDETRKWNDAFREDLNAKVLEHINDEKNMRESTINSDARPATNADLSSWTKTWWNRSVRRTNITGFEDLDDIIATTPLEITAQGAAVEERSWRAQGDGAVYVVRYRITRTPLAPPAPQPTPPVWTPSWPPITMPTTPPSANLSTWVDDWQTTNGRVKLALEGGVLRGQLFLQNVDGSDKEWDRLELRAGTTLGQLVGTATYGSLITQVTLTLSADGQSFTATGQVPGQALYKWSGKRQRSIQTASTSPASAGSVSTPTLPVTEPILAQTTPATPANSTQTPGQVASDFLPLRKFGVRVDRVQPNVAGDALEVYCSFKNLTGQSDNINGSMISAIVTDADGVGYLSDVAFYHPTGAPTLLAGNREVAPQSELQARLLIDIAPGTAPLQTLTLWETTSRPQTVDVSKVQWPGSKPTTNLAALQLSDITTQFEGLDTTLDVRFDGFRQARSGFYEAFFTLKNTGGAQTRDAVLDFNRGSFEVFTVGADGSKQSYQELARANDERATPIVTHYAILPGGEARVRYTFSSTGEVPAPVKVSITDRGSKITREWSIATK